jgi:hypothetical protein
MAALTAREYGWTFMQYLAADPAFTNVMYAAACEHAGVEVVGYVDDEIRAVGIDKIMRGEVIY